MTVEFESLSPEERTVRILVMGHPTALRCFQYILHIKGLAEPNDWSRIILQPHAQEGMITLMKQLR
ncbi:MAG TPA: hypothetical protein IGS37_14760 [Synechococcales cyanobacterium M55_K2018_004]|nr:hypothetical protein [Synechococcales cyanobacterium M55_K2018_004]